MDDEGGEVAAPACGDDDGGLQRAQVRRGAEHEQDVRQPGHGGAAGADDARQSQDDDGGELGHGIAVPPHGPAGGEGGGAGGDGESGGEQQVLEGEQVRQGRQREEDQDAGGDELTADGEHPDPSRAVAQLLDRPHPAELVHGPDHVASTPAEDVPLRLVAPVHVPSDGEIGSPRVRL